jgi:hypothetical protein
MPNSKLALSRREVLLAGMVTAASTVAPIPLGAQPAPLVFMAAGQGSAFLPYGQGLEKLLANSATPLKVVESDGSNQNLLAVNERPGTTGMAFLGSAAAALAGTGAFSGKATPNVRALFPTYNTAFQVAALTSRRIGRITDLDGKTVGVGPAFGPAENFFRVLVEVTGIKPVIVNGTSAELAAKVLAGEVDALWQGAIVPIPALVEILGKAEAIVFGLTDGEIDGMLKRLPYLVLDVTKPGTYQRQTAEIRSVAGWNVVIAHKDLPDDTAYALTKAVLGVSDPKTQIHPFAEATRARNAGVNKIVPYHPGALKALRELGADI